jgi:tetratricopeptide (TPR) repeat protein
MTDRSGGGPSGDDSFLRAIAAAPGRAVDGFGDVDPPRVAHFRVTGRLGSGGMGVVYRAQDEQLQREVALKLLPAMHAGDPERRQRFFREARTAAALVHPNVAVIYQVGEAEGRVYIAMELVAGTTLRQRLVPGGLPEKEARPLALQVAHGLAAAHAKGIVHRDLKPENVMVTRDGAVKLLDFGLAKSGWARDDSASALARADTEAQITREGDVLGSSAYMSPEQALGMVVDARSDVFAFGIVLYEMLSGARPFGGATLGEVRAAIAREEPVPLAERAPGVGPALAGVVMRCLRKSAAERPASAGEIVEALEDLAPPTESEPRQAASRGPTGRPGLRALGLVATFFVVAAVAIGATLPRAPGRTAGTSPGLGPAPSLEAGVSPARVGNEELSRSSNPEAQRAFDDAMRSFREGSGQANTLFLRAAELDPSFGGAYLRLWLLQKDGLYQLLGGRREDPAEARRRLVARANSLSPRDRELEEIGELGDTPELQEKVAAYLERYPGDCLARLEGVAPSLDAIQTAVNGDPTCVPLLAFRAFLLNQSSSDEAAAAYDACLAQSPHAVACLSGRALVRAMEGQCDKAESDVRLLLDVQPESEEGHGTLAGILANKGAPIEGLRQALGGGGAMLSGATLPEAVIPWFEGDFAAVQEVAKGAADRIRGSFEQQDHWLPALARMTADFETGETANGGRVAADFIARSSVWKDRAPILDATAARAAVRGGAMSSADGEKHLAEDAKSLVTTGISPESVWERIYSYRSLYETPEQARSAVRALDVLGAGRPPARGGSHAGYVFFLAGRFEEARAMLDARLTSCTGSLESTPEWVRAHLFLGEIDEAGGRKDSACSHYAKVLARWGHAKPRSVSADEARAHAKTLGCAI